MLYLYDKEEGQVINVGRPTHIERAKTKYGQNNQERWFWILTYRNGSAAHTKYYPCKRYEFHMMMSI